MSRKFAGCVTLAVMVILTIAMCVYFSKHGFLKSKIGKNNFVIEEQETIVDNKITLKAKEIHDYMREHNYGYCTYDYRCNHDGSCGLNSTFEASKKGYHNTCCATYVSWVLQETGYITKKQHVDNNFNAANNLSKFLSKNGWRALEKNEKLQPGDILCFNHHIAIYGGRGSQYDAGNRGLLEFPAPCVITGGLNVSNAEKVLRAPDIENIGEDLNKEGEPKNEV